MVGEAMSSVKSPGAVDLIAIAAEPDYGYAPGPVFLQVSDLVKTYGARPAVAGVSFSISSGECFGLLGPNGAGKTTTILSICGLIKPDSGQVQVGEGRRDPGAARTRRDIGYVPQEIALYEDLSGRENLRFFGRLYGLTSKHLKDRIEATLAFVDLTSRADQKVGAYSGGMKRRLNIAAALLHEPGLLVLDEPTVGIDPQSRNSILENLAALRSSGTAVLYTSHYMEEVERLCDRIAIMDDGKILAEGTRGSLLELLGERVDQVRLATLGAPEAKLVQSLRRLKGVSSVGTTSDGLELTARDVTQTLPRVLAAVARHETAVTGLTVGQADLESVFLHLTGKGLRDG
jgi:ABC-2 type transport system ATP-binding protein